MIDLVRSELIKIRTVRSTVILLGVVVLLSLVPAVLIAALVGEDSLDLTNVEDRLQLSLVGVAFSQILLAVIAALVIAGEFRFGTIRTTFVAEPRRLRVLAAKTVTVAALAGVVAAVMVGLTTGITALVLNARGIDFSFTAGDSERVLYGTVLYSMLYAVMALGIATIVRNAPGSIVLVIVLPLIVENVLFGILSVLDRESWTKWLPFTAGSGIAQATSGDSVIERFAPWTGFAYGCLWAAALLAVGGWLLRSRDA